MNEASKLIHKITERAEKEELLANDRLSLIMDLEVANKEFDLKLEKLLNADLQDFSHDIIKIQTHLDRANKKFEKGFVPRYANMEGK